MVGHYIYYYLAHEAELSDTYTYLVRLRSSSAVICNGRMEEILDEAASYFLWGMREYLGAHRGLDVFRVFSPGDFHPVDGTSRRSCSIYCDIWRSGGVKK
jgi:hypothetical protein